MSGGAGGPYRKHRGVIKALYGKKGQGKVHYASRSKEYMRPSAGQAAYRNFMRKRLRELGMERGPGTKLRNQGKFAQAAAEWTNANGHTEVRYVQGLPGRNPNRRRRFRLGAQPLLKAEPMDVGLGGRFRRRR